MSAGRESVLKLAINKYRYISLRLKESLLLLWIKIHKLYYHREQQQKECAPQYESLNPERLGVELQKLILSINKPENKLCLNLFLIFVVQVRSHRMTERALESGFYIFNGVSLRTLTVPSLSLCIWCAALSAVTDYDKYRQLKSQYGEYYSMYIISYYSEISSPKKYSISKHTVGW